MCDEEMPREALRRDPKAAGLSDAELLAVALGSGVRGCPAMAIAERLLAAFDSLTAFARADHLEMKAAIERYNARHPDAPIAGMGETRLMKLAAAFKLSSRAMARQDWDFRNYNLRSSAAAFELFKRVLASAPEKERFFVLPMDSDFHALVEPIGISEGTIDRTPVHPREVFCEAVRYRAYAIIVAHNHPCGDLTPSDDDLALTRELIAAGKLMGIRVLDHLVIGADGGKTGYVSVRAMGELEF